MHERPTQRTMKLTKHSCRKRVMKCTWRTQRLVRVRTTKRDAGEWSNKQVVFNFLLDRVHRSHYYPWHLLQTGSIVDVHTLHRSKNVLLKRIVSWFTDVFEQRERWLLKYANGRSFTILAAGATASNNPKKNRKLKHAFLKLSRNKTLAYRPRDGQ